MKKREFEQIAVDFIRKHKLISDNDMILVACSGGADSVCLSPLLKKISGLFSAKIHLVHINHNLRKASVIDEKFVMDFAKKYSFELDLLSVRIGNQAGTLEEKARNIRHSALIKIAKKIGATKIALGHTSNDRAETVIHNLIRGTGLTGVSSMQPTNGNLIRPILFASKVDVINYLNDNNQEYIVDESNSDLQFSRNRIRHKIIPELQKIFPGATRSISRFANISEAESEYLNKNAKRLYDECVKNVDGKYIIDIDKINKSELVLIRRVIRMIMTEKNLPPTFSIVEKVVMILDNNGNKSERLGCHLVEKINKTLEITTLRELD